MAPPDFQKECKVTTMTIIAPFKGEIYLPSIFNLLTVSPVVMLPSKSNRLTKPKIPVHPVAGSIVSLRYNGTYRGVWGPSFKNAIMIDMSISGEKNINVKLSKGKMHICGPVNDKQAMDAANFLSNYLTNIQKVLDYLYENPSVIKECSEWIENNCQGPEKTFPVHVLEKVLPTNGKGKAKIRRVQTGIKDCISYKPFQTWDKNLNKETMSFLQMVLSDCEKFEEVKTRLTLLQNIKTVKDMEALIAAREELKEKKVPKKNKVKVPPPPEPLACRVISEPLTFGPISHLMVNCCYQLDFAIDRDKLNKLINARGENVISQYNGTSSHYVKIEFPYTKEEAGVLINRKGKVASCSMTVCSSGYVMQSSKNYQLMEAFFYLFRNIIEEIKDQIKDEDPQIDVFNPPTDTTDATLPDVMTEEEEIN
jgi:hypothetical protein